MSRYTHAPQHENDARAPFGRALSVEGEGVGKGRPGEEDDDSVRRVWMVKAMGGGEGKGLVVWYSGDDLGCIASRMPHLDYNIGHRFTRIWRYSVADQRYPEYALIKPSRLPVKLEDTLSDAWLLCERKRGRKLGATQRSYLAYGCRSCFRSPL